MYIVNRLDIVSYKSVYSLRIIIKPATLKASFSTLLFPAAIEQYNYTCLHFLGWCHIFDVFVLFVVTPVIFALFSLIVVYDFYFYLWKTPFCLNRAFPMWRVGSSPLTGFLTQGRVVGNIYSYPRSFCRSGNPLKNIA